MLQIYHKIALTPHRLTTARPIVAQTRFQRRKNYTDFYDSTKVIFKWFKSKLQREDDSHNDSPVFCDVICRVVRSCWPLTVEQHIANSNRTATKWLIWWNANFEQINALLKLICTISLCSRHRWDRSSFICRRICARSSFVLSILISQFGERLPFVHWNLSPLILLKLFAWPLHLSELELVLWSKNVFSFIFKYSDFCSIQTLMCSTEAKWRLDQ